ncbi:hypothetical protein BC826DRAFT_1148629 [Russula brevipes]|nr:hypothetical protein BC826DRAFT_1148629 [Russula brevipes]
MMAFSSVSVVTSSWQLRRWARPADSALPGERRVLPEPLWVEACGVLGDVWDALGACGYGCLVRKWTRRKLCRRLLVVGSLLMCFVESATCGVYILTRAFSCGLQAGCHPTLKLKPHQGIKFKR